MAEATRFEMTKPAADRVLIVEDEENARIGYEALLRRWGYEVLGVGSAEDALARFSEFAPAVLIADVELPGMNGLDLLARLGDELKTVPAIIITGKGSEERIIAAIEAGAFWYIEKPLKARGVAIAAGPRAGPRPRSAAGGGADAPACAKPEDSAI